MINKVFVVSMNRASDGALTKLISLLRENNMLALYESTANIFLVCGDRIETYDKALELYGKNKFIVHLWSGEISQGTHDEVYRHSITLMSKMQLCTDNKTKLTTENLLKSVDMKPCAFVVGNVYLDNMSFDNVMLPKKPYDLILYNPPTIYDAKIINKDLDFINSIKSKNHFWIEANGDKGSDLINKYITCPNLNREMFLSLLKNCERFISNSSSIYYEAQFLIEEHQIIKVGERNKNRSEGADMSIKNASKKIIKILKEIKND